jgi:hypothetical protein
MSWASDLTWTAEVEALVMRPEAAYTEPAALALGLPCPTHSPRAHRPRPRPRPHPPAQVGQRLSQRQTSHGSRADQALQVQRWGGEGVYGRDTWVVGWAQRTDLPRPRKNWGTCSVCGRTHTPGHGLQRVVFVHQSC